MNEHDSERIAGLLEADGLSAGRLGRRRRRRRAQHVLHPRERRQQAVRPPRPPEARRRTPGPTCRSSWPAAWPRRTASSSGRRRRTSTSCSAPTTSTAPSTARPRPRRRAGHRDLRRGRARRPRAVPVGAAGPARDHLQRLGHDPDRLRQLVRVLHRAGRPRAGDQPAVRRHRRRGRGAGRRRRHRGHAARPERQLLRARPHARRPAGAATPAARRAAAVRRPAAGRRRRRRASAGSASRARTRRTSARHDRRPWPTTPAVCEHLHLPLQAGSRPRARRHAPRLHGRALPRASWPRPARAIADLAVSTDIIVGFPGETDDDFERTLEVVAAAEYDFAYTFIFSPRPGTEAAEHDRAVRRPGDVAASVSSGCGSSSSAARWPSTGPAIGRVEEVLVEGPSQEGSGRHHRPHPPAQARALPRRRPPAAPGHLRHGRGHRRRAAPPLGRLVERRRPSRPTRPASRWWPAERARRASDAPSLGADRRRASRPWRWPARPGRDPGDVEIVAVDAMQVYRGMDIGTAKPTAGRAGRGPPPLLDLVDPSEDVTVVALPGAPPTQALADDRRARPSAVLVGGTGLYLRAVIDQLEPPGRWPDVRGRARGRAGHGRASTTGCRRLDPVARRQDGADQPPARRAGTRGTRRQRPPVQLASDRASTATRRRRRADRPALAPRRPRPRASSARFDALLAAGFLDEVAALAARPGGLSRTAAPGARLQRAARPPRRPCSLDEAVATHRAPAPAASPCARSGGSAAIHASAGSTSTTIRSSPLPDVLGGVAACGVTLTKHHGLGNDFLVLFDDQPLPEAALVGARPALVRPAHGASAPTACWSG